MGFVSAPLPFVKIGNRRGLTMLQIIENPEIADFVSRFPSSFERVMSMDAVLFIEPDQEPN